MISAIETHWNLHPLANTHAEHTKLTQEYVNIRKLGQDFRDIVWRRLRIHSSSLSIIRFFA